MQQVLPESQPIKHQAGQIISREIGDGQIDIVFKDLSYFVALPEKHPFTKEQKEKLAKLENYRNDHPELNGKPVMMQDIENNAVELEVHEKIFKQSAKVYTVPDRHKRVLFQDDMIGKYPPNHKIILNKLSGICKSGECTAILGPTGAGKTSLLNVLCCRIENSKTDLLSGSMTANEENYNYKSFADFGAYVYQEINLMEALTIKETLMFTATMKMGGTFAERENRVNQVLHLLQLEKAQNILVGGQNLRGATASERKRCSVAIEIINNPQVIFLDEPTSGLDSVTAFALMRLMKNYAINEKKTVIFTIHQPSSDIWHLFDRIMLMVQGNFIYQGAGGKAIIDYFDKIGFVNPQFANPGDFYMSIMHAEKKVNILNYPYLIVSCQDKQLAGPVTQEIEKHRTNGYNKVGIDIHWAIQFSQNLKREVIQTKRSIDVVLARIINLIGLSLFLGCVYWNMSDGSDQSIADINACWVAVNNRVAFQFLCSFGVYILAGLTVLLQFPQERGVFLKEQASRMYSISSYFCAKIVAEIPWAIVNTCILTIILIFMANLRYDDEGYVGKLMFLFFLCLSGGTALGFFSATFFSSGVQAIETIPMILVVPGLFSGVVVSRDKYPEWSKWIQYISPYKYASEAMIQNEFSINHFPSQTNPLDIFPPEFSYWEASGFLILLTVVFYLGAAIALYAFKSKLQ